MITTKAVAAPYAAVQIRKATGLVQLLGKIVWSTDFNQGLHCAGVHFVLRFGR